MDNPDRIRRAGQAAYVAATSGVIALATIGLFFSVGQPFGTLNDAALLVMTLALVPVAIGFRDLGSRMPAGIAQATLACGIAAMLAWSAVQVAMMVGLVSFDYYHGATGAFAAESIALAAIGVWLISVNAIAGIWLAALPRWLGILSGAGFVGTAAGLLLGGVNHPLTYLGGIGYSISFPIWAYLIGRGLAHRRFPMARAS